MFIEAALLPGNEMVQKPEPETVLITVPVPLRQKSYGSYISGSGFATLAVK